MAGIRALGLPTGFRRQGVQAGQTQAGELASKPCNTCAGPFGATMRACMRGRAACAHPGLAGIFQSLARRDRVRLGGARSQHLLGFGDLQCAPAIFCCSALRILSCGASNVHRSRPDAGQHQHEQNDAFTQRQRIDFLQSFVQLLHGSSTFTLATATPDGSSAGIQRELQKARRQRRGFRSR
jgi:hypothetical protein